MCIMVQIMSKTHTFSNVSGMKIMWQTIVEYTHTLIMNIYTHHFGKAEKKKTIARRLL